MTLTHTNRTHPHQLETSTPSNPSINPYRHHWPVPAPLAHPRTFGTLHRHRYASSPLARSMPPTNDAHPYQWRPSTPAGDIHTKQPQHQPIPAPLACPSTIGPPPHLRHPSSSSVRFIAIGTEHASTTTISPGKLGQKKLSPAKAAGCATRGTVGHMSEAKHRLIGTGTTPTSVEPRTAKSYSSSASLSNQRGAQHFHHEAPSAEAAHRASYCAR